MKKIRSVPMIFANIRFANDILARRIELKLTQREVAELVGVQGSTVGSYESADEDNPKMQNFVNFCNLFDLNPSDYFELGS